MMYARIYSPSRWWPLPFVLLALAMLAACEASSTPTPTTPGSNPTTDTASSPAQLATPTVMPQPETGTSPKYGGVVPMSAKANPGTLDPHRGPTTFEIGAVAGFYNQVLTYDPVNPPEIIGDLAKDWDLSADGYTYTFTIHDNVKWWDGMDLTADDVVYSILRSMETGQPRPKGALLRGYIDTVEKVDRNTFTIQMKYPNTSFISTFAIDFNKVLPQHHIEAGNDINLWGNILGSGPFKPVEFRDGVSYEWEKNPDYWKAGRPYFDGIKVFIITDKQTEIAAYKTERVLMNHYDDLQMDIPDVLALEKDPGFTDKYGIYWRPGVDGMAVVFNTQKPPFDDERVRKAFFLAIDRQALIEALGYGKYTIGSPMSPLFDEALPESELLQLPGYRRGPNGEKHPDDIAEAQRLMAEAGYPEGRGFNTIYYTQTIAEWSAVHQLIKEQLQGVFPEIQLELRVVDYPGWLSRARPRDFTIGADGYGAGANPEEKIAALYTLNDRNYSDWHRDNIDKLFQSWTQELDPEKRKELSRELQLQLLDGTAGRVEFWWKTTKNIVSHRIRTEKGEWVMPPTLTTVLSHEHEWLEPK
jgi:peptide/nickel transport system substrate-binding protein